MNAERSPKKDPTTASTRASGVRARARVWAIGDRVGGWELRRRLNEPDGGSQVFLAASSVGTSRIVRISKRQGALEDDPVVRAQRHGMGATHPNLVTVRDMGEIAGQAYVVREMMPGLDARTALAALVNRRRAFDTGLVVMLGLSVCRALHHLHHGRSALLVHGELRPSNILIGTHGQVKLADLGSSCSPEEVATPLVRPGSELWAAPEQIEGELVDERTDVYGLGLLLATLATGQVPPRDDDEPAPSLAGVALLAPELLPLVRACVGARGERPGTIRGVASQLAGLVSDPAGWTSADLVRALRSRKGALPPGLRELPE